jgi:hypothetical protein
MSKLIKQILDYKLSKYNDFEITHRYVLSVWHFYSVYNICLAITGYEDPDTRKKNALISRFISSSPKKVDLALYSKILSLIKKDMEVVNLAIQIMEAQKEGSAMLGDYYLEGMIGISVYA